MVSNDYYDDTPADVNVTIHPVSSNDEQDYFNYKDVVVEVHDIKINGDVVNNPTVQNIFL